jgi:hypothetical protein
MYRKENLKSTPYTTSRGAVLKRFRARVCNLYLCSEFASASVLRGLGK